MFGEKGIRRAFFVKNMINILLFSKKVKRQLTKGFFLCKI